MEKLGSKIYKSLWWEQNFDWECVEAEGRSGGILSIWNDKIFCKTSSWQTRGVLAVNGFLKEDGSQVCILNVYAPCSTTDRIILWDIICNYLASYSATLVCVMGDFNAIRSPNERSGRGCTIDQRDIYAFNEFIA